MPPETAGPASALVDWGQPVSRIPMPGITRSQLSTAVGSLRWTQRAVFAAPFAVLVASHPPSTAATPNGDLLARAAGMDWTSGGVGWIRDVFPPIATLLGLPGSAILLGLVGAAMAGYLLQRLLEALAQRGCSPAVGGVLLLVLGMNPLTAYLVVDDTVDFLGLVLLGLALANAYRFAAWKSTQAGFRSGVQLMLAVLTTPLAVPLAGAVALAVFLMSRVRSRDRQTRRSTVVVVVFPAVSALATLTAMTLLFGRDPLGFVEHGTFARIPEHVETAVALGSGRVGLLLALAVVAAIAIGAVLARVDMIAVAVIIPVGIVGFAMLGLVDVGTVALVVPIALLIATIAQLPGAMSRARLVLVPVLGVGLAAVTWAVALQSAPVLELLHSVA